jgi:hypothetical protein
LVAERNVGLRFDLGAFDLDGTLLRRDLEITDRTLAAVEGLRERGMRLVVATGRRYESAVEHAEKLGFGGEDPVVCYGGSMVRRMDGETLLHRTLPKDLGLEVLEWAAGRGPARPRLRGRACDHLPEQPGRPAVLEAPRGARHRRGRFAGRVARRRPRGADEARDRGPPRRRAGWLEEAQEAFRGRLFVTRSLPHYVEVGGLEGTNPRPSSSSADGGG